MEGLVLEANRQAVLSSGVEVRNVHRLQGVVNPFTISRSFSGGIATELSPNKSPFLSMDLAAKKDPPNTSFYVFFPVSDVTTTYTININGTDHDKDVTDNASGILEAFYVHFTTEFEGTDSVVNKVTLPDNTRALEFVIPNADFTSCEISVTGGSGTIEGYCEVSEYSFNVMYQKKKASSLFEGIWYFINMPNSSNIAVNVTEVLRCGQYSHVYVCINAATAIDGFTGFDPVVHVTYTFGSVN